MTDYARYPLARQRAGGQAARYEAAARTAFTDEVTAAGGGAGGGAGLVWVQGEAAPALLMDQATTAVSLAPLVCGHNIRAGGPLGSVFTLADMEVTGDSGTLIMITEPEPEYYLLLFCCSGTGCGRGWLATSSTAA